MRLLRNLFRRVRGLVRAETIHREIDEEARFHIEMRIDENIRRGMPPEEARRDAERRFGNLTRMKERGYEVRGGRWLETLWQDLRYGVRMLGRNPGFTLVAVLTLGFGIGANTAIFSLIDAVLLKMLPVKDPEQLVLLSHANSRTVSNRFQYRVYKHFQDHNEVLSGILAYHPLRMTVSMDGQPEAAVFGQIVTGNYYAVLGVNAELGRTITPEDDRAPGASPVCVISHSYWQRRFASDPAIVGKTIHLSGAPFTIIGVTGPEFFGLEIGNSFDISIPVMMQEQVTPGIPSFMQGGGDRFLVMGRLRPGITIHQAQAGLQLLYQQYLTDRLARRADSPNRKKPPDQSMLEDRMALAAGSNGLSELRRQFSQPLFVLMIVVALVLLIACANVGGLMLTLAVARRKEIAVRLALGSSRLRLIRQLLTESVLLAGLGGLLGLLFTYWGTRLLLPLLSLGEFPLHLDLSPDARVLGYTATVATLTGLLFGIAPAFWATRVDLNTTLKNDSLGQGGCGAHLTFGQVFVIAQVALSLLLLVGAGLFVRSLQKLRQVETGFVRENILVLRLEPVGSDRKTNESVWPRLKAFYEELIRHVEALPGVRHASLVGYSPISRREWSVMGQAADLDWAIYVQGYAPQSDDEMRVHWMQVYPNSFLTLGIPLAAGRDFTRQDDREAQKVAVINESMARHFFGNESPLGRRFGIGLPERSGEIEIIGVVKDAKYKSLREGDRAMFYLPFNQASTGRGQMTLIVRTAGDPTLLAAAVQREARTLDPAMPMFEVETLEAQIAASLSQDRLVATLSGIFGLLALFLSCLGLYGILSYSVTRRTNEIGIRLALGADHRNVLWLVLRDALRLTLIGAVLGIPAALAAARLIASQLFGLSTADPVAIGLATLALLVVAAVASYLPARRATRVDPLVALRSE